MTKYFFYLLISLLFFNQTFAQDINIKENINLEFVCDLEKKIIKNSEYNYQTFLAKDLNKKNLDKFQILSKIKEKIITTIGARFDKKVAFDTVVSFIDQCQQIKSRAKKIPETRKIT